MAFAPDDQRVFGSGFINRLIARPSFQEFANRIPFVRQMARRDGAEIFDLVQGFVRSQVLGTLVQLNILEKLLDHPTSSEAMAFQVELSPQRMELLLKAGVGIGMLKRHRDGRYGLTRKGAALLGVPGLRQMILHHGAFYRDMGDPLALLRSEADTELAAFWPYVFGAFDNVDPDVTRTYSDLMADSQKLVAADTLSVVSLTGVRHLADVGGGSGAFLIEVAKAYPNVSLTLFDLPEVMSSAAERLSLAGLADRIECLGGSFREDPLPANVDAISLVRVLYDHNEASVAALLEKVYAALPPRGMLLISEPMSGGDKADPITDVYFAFYTLAMRTGRTRSPGEIKALCEQAGFVDVAVPRPVRSFVTSVVTAVKPG